MITDTARKLRRYIETLATSLDDEKALDAKELFPHWYAGKEYEIGLRLYYEGKLYKVLQAHTSQDAWTPDFATSLFSEVLIPDPSVIPEWVQPDSTNPYMTGDKVRHNGKAWVSTIDYNVYEPGVYGWDEVN